MLFYCFPKDTLQCKCTSKVSVSSKTTSSAFDRLTNAPFSLIYRERDQRCLLRKNTFENTQRREEKKWNLLTMF